MGEAHIQMDWVDKSSEPHQPMDWVNESSKDMTLYFHRVFHQLEVLLLQSHVMTYDLLTLTACLFVSPYIIGSYQTHYSIQDPR